MIYLGFTPLVVTGEIESGVLWVCHGPTTAHSQRIDSRNPLGILWRRFPRRHPNVSAFSHLIGFDCTAIPVFEMSTI